MGHNDFIYADNAATTAVLPEILEAMLPYYSEEYGNPSSLYAPARRAKAALEKARTQIADCFGVKKSEIYFTSSGTESNNWAIRSILEAKRTEGKSHLIISAIEHPSVLNTAKAWAKQGGSVTYLPVNAQGIVEPAQLSAALRPSTALVSVMTANNEIGTIQPIAQLGEICHAQGVLFHTDAVQAVGHLSLNLQELPIDMLSFTGHKFHGPKGIGALFVRTGLNLPPLLFGGEQEREKRPGTENVAGAVGLAAALTLAQVGQSERNNYVQGLRDRLIEGVLQIPGSSLNGSRTERLPGNANFCFTGIEGESLLLMLDMRGICCSSGSACSSGAVDPSHVILALGIPKDLARSSLRISLSHLNTEEEVDAIVQALTDCTGRLRRLIPG